MIYLRNYDWKLVEDDCRFVMRKGYNECKTAKGEWKGFEYVYRCVKFRSFGINMGK